jgi:hypothetical protein
MRGSIWPVLKRLFLVVGGRAVEALVKETPTGTYSRRIWFLYEWLLGERLNLDDAEKGAYGKVVDTEQQWAIKGETSPRHPTLEQSSRYTGRRGILDGKRYLIHDRDPLFTAEFLGMLADAGEVG